MADELEKICEKKKIKLYMISTSRTCSISIVMCGFLYCLIQSSFGGGILWTCHFLKPNQKFNLTCFETLCILSHKICWNPNTDPIVEGSEDTVYSKWSYSLSLASTWNPKTDKSRSRTGHPVS